MITGVVAIAKPPVDKAHMAERIRQIDDTTIRRTEEGLMTAAIAPPTNYMPPTASAALIVPAPAYAPAYSSASYFPEGINYERWAPLVHAAPRDAFADRLDLLDLFDDD